MTEFEESVYMEVKKIPKGSIETYKSIAIKVGRPNAQRAVGNALHKNPDNKNIPCHRVISSSGECSANFAFGGKRAQKLLLEKEGHKFKDGKYFR